MSAKSTPKRLHGRVVDPEVMRTKPTTGGASVTLLDGRAVPNATDNGKIQRRSSARLDLLKTLPGARQRVFERHYADLAKNEKTRRKKARNK